MLCCNFFGVRAYIDPTKLSKLTSTSCCSNYVENLWTTHLPVVLWLVVICSFIKLTLVLGNESSSFSTHAVINNADTLQFGDIFKISVDKDRLYSCSIQLHVMSVTDAREQCWVGDVLVMSVFCSTSIACQCFNISLVLGPRHAQLVAATMG